MYNIDYIPIIIHEHFKRIIMNATLPHKCIECYNGAMSITVLFKRLHPDAIIPDQAYEGDAGFDLYAIEHVELKNWDSKT